MPLIISRDSPATTDQMLQFLRIVHGVLMFSIALYVGAIRVISRQTAALSNPNLPIIFGVLAASAIALAFYFRSRFIDSAFDTLRTRPDDAAALKRWRQGVMVSDVLAEAVALYGFALYVMGGQIWQGVAFIVVAELFMVLWWPRRP